MSVSSKMTAIATWIRSICGGQNLLSLDEMASELSGAKDEVDDQSDLISQISTVLQSKIGGGVTVTPLSVTENGTYTAPSGTAYSPVTVNVSGEEPTLETVSVTPSESAQQITPSEGYDGIGQANVAAIPSNFVGSGVARKSSSDLTVSGATVTVPAGYYAASASKSFPIYDGSVS